MFGKLANHFSSLTDVRYVTDPWGLGMKIPVLRAGAEEWTKWNEEHTASSGMDEAFKRTQLARMADSIVEQLDEPDKPGFRRRRKAAKGAASEMRRDSMRSVLREAINDIPLDQLSKAADPNDLKLGLAMVGMPEEHAGKRYCWSGVEDEGGEAMPYTLENRLRLLGWKGVMLEVSGSRFGTVRYFGDAAETACAAAHAAGIAMDEPSDTHRYVVLDGNPRDDEGNLLWVPEFSDSETLDGKPASVPYGNQPVGDAITDWLLDECEAGDTIHGKVVEESVANLLASPSGGSATSAD